MIYLQARTSISARRPYTITTAPTLLLAYWPSVSNRAEEADRVNCEQGDHDRPNAVSSCRQDGTAVQEVCGVDTREGRLNTFPNILWNKVQPLKSIDSTTSGHRKIIAPSLVCASIRIISIANIPCQQHERRNGKLVEEQKGVLLVFRWNYKIVFLLRWMTSRWAWKRPNCYG